MKIVKTLLTWEEAPTLRRLPIAIGRAAISGVIIGPFFAIAMQLLLKPERTDLLLRPVFYLYSIGIGALFATSFYVTCGLPQHYLTPLAVRWPARRTRLIRVLLGAMGGMAGIAIAMYSMQYLFGMVIDNIDQMGRILAFDAILGAVIALLVGAWIQRDLREKQLEAAAATAQSKALQAQINPHFFFNTLNTVQALIDTEPKQAKEIIGGLSSMFRYTLRCSDKSMVPFSEELDLVRHYLSIESARFGTRLRYTLPEITEDFDLPGLMLQPLVENAVRHGIAKRIDGGEVRVSLASNGSGRGITVESPVTGPLNLAPEQLFQSGHALDNIRERLRLLYGDRASLALEQNGEIVHATLVFPP